MTLDQTKNGSEVKILSIQDLESKSRLGSLGISEDSKVVCLDKFPWGRMILRFETRMVTVERRLAQAIQVECLNNVKRLESV